MPFQEAMKQSGTLLEKANEQMEEQEDEIKKLNEVVLVLIAYCKLLDRLFPLMVL